MKRPGHMVRDAMLRIAPHHEDRRQRTGHSALCEPSGIAGRAQRAGVIDRIAECRTAESSQQGLKQAGDAVVDTAGQAGTAVAETAKTTGSALGKASSAVGHAAKKSWDCVASLFKDC